MQTGNPAENDMKVFVVEDSAAVRKAKELKLGA